MSPTDDVINYIFYMYYSGCDISTDTIGHGLYTSQVKIKPDIDIAIIISSHYI